MPRGDIHNRKKKLERIKSRISESGEILEHNKEILSELDDFNIENREVGLDRRCRDLETWYSLAEHIGNSWKLDEPTKERISTLIGDIKKGNVTKKDNPSISQINEFKKSLNKMYHARQNGDISLLKYKNSNYKGEQIASFTYTKRKKNVDPETVLRPEDVAKLLENANRIRDKTYIILMWSTAARVGEILGLKWKDINITRVKGRRVVEVRIKDRDKTDKPEDTKTSTMKVPVREGYTFLKQFKKSDPLSDDPEAFLFRPANSTDPNEQLSHNSGSSMVRRSLKKIREREDIEWNENRKTNNHNFRHSRATYWASEGMNESQIRALGGWSNSSDTVRDYIHLGKRDINGAVLDFHGLEKEEEDDDYTLEPIPCSRCNTLNPFNASTCRKPGCDYSLSMSDQAEELWIEETSKEVAMEIAHSEGQVTQDEIQKTAQELVQNKMKS